MRTKEADKERASGSSSQPPTTPQRQRIQVGIKGRWTPWYEKEIGLKLKEYIMMTEEVNKYKQLAGVNI